MSLNSSANYYPSPAGRSSHPQSPGVSEVQMPTPYGPDHYNYQPFDSTIFDETSGPRNYLDYALTYEDSKIGPVCPPSSGSNNSDSDSVFVARARSPESPSNLNRSVPQGEGYEPLHIPISNNELCPNSAGESGNQNGTLPSPIPYQVYNPNVATANRYNLSLTPVTDTINLNCSTNPSSVRHFTTLPPAVPQRERFEPRYMSAPNNALRLYNVGDRENQNRTPPSPIPYQVYNPNVATANRYNLSLTPVTDTINLNSSSNPSRLAHSITLPPAVPQRARFDPRYMSTPNNALCPYNAGDRGNQDETPPSPILHQVTNSNVTNANRYDLSITPLMDTINLNSSSNPSSLAHFLTLPPAVPQRTRFDPRYMSTPNNALCPYNAGNSGNQNETPPSPIPHQVYSPNVTDSNRYELSITPVMDTINLSCSTYPSNLEHFGTVAPEAPQTERFEPICKSTPICPYYVSDGGNQSEAPPSPIPYQVYSPNVTDSNRCELSITPVMDTINLNRSSNSSGFVHFRTLPPGEPLGGEFISSQRVSNSRVGTDGRSQNEASPPQLPNGARLLHVALIHNEDLRSGQIIEDNFRRESVDGGNNLYASRNILEGNMDPFQHIHQRIQQCGPESNILNALRFVQQRVQPCGPENNILDAPHLPCGPQMMQNTDRNAVRVNRRTDERCAEMPRPQLNMNESDANATLDEMIEATIKGFNKLAQTMKKRKPMNCIADLPSDRDELNRFLHESIVQTESNLSNLRKSMQDTLADMTKIIAKRGNLQIPEIRNLASELQPLECPPGLPSENQPAAAQAPSPETEPEPRDSEILPEPSENEGEGSE